MTKRAIPLADVATPDELRLFDEAMSAELLLVSRVPYNSREICEFFASNVRKRIAVALAAARAEGAAS